MNENQNFTFIESCVLENDIYDLLPKIMKITGTLLYIGFFLLAIKIKEMRSRHMIYLHNLAFVGLSTTCFYGFTSFNTYCEAPLVSMCEYQALFAYYTIYVTAYGVVALALYRLACVKMLNVNVKLTKIQLLSSVFLIWIIPIFSIIIPSYALRIPIFYNVSSASCRIDLSQHIDFFMSYFIIANVLPSVLVITIDLLVFSTLKASKNRVHAHNRRQSQYSKTKPLKISIEFRLLLQQIILFIVFEIYAIANGILLFQASTTNKLLNTDVLKILRLFRWGYHVINPIVYLFFHPIILEKVKKVITNCFWFQC